MNTLQALYDSEINWKISTFWDGGFEWGLGVRRDGYLDYGKADTLEEAITALAEAAREHFPDSVFAKEQEVDFRELLAKMREIEQRDGLAILSKGAEDNLRERAMKELTK